MIRIFKLAAAYTAIGLLYARYRLNMNEVGPAVMQDLGEADMPEERCAQVAKVMEFIDGEGRRGVVIPTLDDILDTLLLAITSDPPPDESIIDRMGSFLKHPFGINLVGDKLIKQLRKALLSSADFEVLQEMMSRMEHRCLCGHTFMHGEGVYFAGTGAVQLMCFRCSLPSYSSCMSCSDGNVPMNQNARNAMTSAKQVCQECKEKKAAEVRAAAAPPAPDVLQNHLQDRLGRLPRVAVDPQIIMRERMFREAGDQLRGLVQLDEQAPFEVWQEPLPGDRG